MKINSQPRRTVGLATLPSWAFGTILAVAGIILALTLPGPALFVVGLAAAIGCGISVADLSRAGGTDVPAMRFGRAD